MNGEPEIDVWMPREEDGNSFEDSERFEDDDSQVSWGTSVDGVNQNWRGWSSCPSSGEAIQPGLSCVVYQYPQSGRFSSASTNTVVQQRHSRNENPTGNLQTLAEVSARVCAEKWSFQQLEEMYQGICISRARNMPNAPPPTTIPEKIFLSFIVHCFPQSTDEIRMYSTLANGTCEQYNSGNTLYQMGSVRDVSQTGFLLSANVQSTAEHGAACYEAKTCSGNNAKESFHVTVKVDRCRIVECTCECSNRSSWCQHVVALCIYRINQKHNIKFNETIADAINSMSDFELRRLVQWHINEIPRKCIPGFQTLIDQIKDPNSDINNIDGAPDPTDGGHEPVSRFDFPEIEDKVRRLLCKYCVPTPSVHCDVQYLSATQHPTTVEWNTLIKPLRAREPEGMWNLLQIVREMFARGDENAVALLRTITDECLANTQVLLWWYITKLVQSGCWSQTMNGKSPSATQLLAQHNCAHLCDEVVTLWKCVAINPRASKFYRSQLAAYLQEYHRNAVNRLKHVIECVPTLDQSNPRADATLLSNHQTVLLLQNVFFTEDNQVLSAQNMRFTVDWFPGFYPALQMCHFLSENNVNFGVPKDAFFDLAAPDLSKTVKMLTPKSKKSKKKKKKSKKHHRSRRSGVEDPLEGPSNRNHHHDEIRGMWRVVHNVHHRNKVPVDPQQESTESGQESDVQSLVKTDQMKKQKFESVDMDVNEVLAAAFTPLDAIESRFLKCEAFATHGYRVDAIEEALRIIDYLLDSLIEQSECLNAVQKEEQDFLQSEEFVKSELCVKPIHSKEITEEKDVSRCSTDSDKSSNLISLEIETPVLKSNKFLSTIEKLLYVTKVLNASQNLHLKVFWLALKTLSVTKFPLVTNHQQLALYYYEAEFVAILQQLSVTSARPGSIEIEHVRSVAKQLIHENAGNNGDVAPIALAQFIFETLHSPFSDELGSQNNPSHHNRRLHKAGDDELAIHVALNMLGSQANFPEAIFPISCEAIRRSKNELGMVLLSRFKDSHEMLGLIMDKILDPNRHRMYSHHASNAAYFLERCPTYLKYHKNKERPVYPYREGFKQEEPNHQKETGEVEKLEKNMKMINMFEDNLELDEARRKTEQEDAEVSDDGLQSSSSSETTSTGTQCSVWPAPRMSYGLTKYNAATLAQLYQQQKIVPRNSQEGQLISRKMKRRLLQTLGHCQSGAEAHVYHMHELSRKVLQEAGGQHNNVFALGNPMIGGTHRKLHLCSVIIAVYAMGMNNRLSPSWNTRTYSTSASWIAGQVYDIGPSAVEMIRETWTAHFTPSEIATISDRAGPSADPLMRKEAAKLALSVLPFSHSLNDEEVSSALDKCREDGREMLIQGLKSMDVNQFRAPARTKPLFAAMRHWIDLSMEEDELNQMNMGKYRQYQPVVPNPYADPRISSAAIGSSFGVPPALMQQQHQYNQQHPATNVMHPHLGMYNNPPPVHQNMVVQQQQQQHQQHQQNQQQQQFLYPMMNQGDQARIHQSHSAPQLGTSSTNQMPNQNSVEGIMEVDETVMQHHIPTMYLMNAFRFGIRAMDCFATSQGEERQMYLKFGPSPPYCDEINKLYNVATKLGASQLLTFFNTAARAILSPYVLHQYAKDSTKFFPHRPYCPPPPPVQSQSLHRQMNTPSTSANPQIPALMQHVPKTPFPSGPMPTYRHSHIKFSSPGMISALFVQNGYHHVTGELFERTCEQYLQAIINKLNSPRLSDTYEICSFITSAYEAFQWIPAPISRNLFDDFVRTFKKQKAFKKEIANSINNLLNQMC